MVEWTGRQQLLFLLQSGGVGFFLGLLFAAETAVGQVCCRRWQRFCLDGAFGAVAALVTFFASLAIMDGQLHPLLFLGSLIGFVAAYTSVGRPLRALCCRVLRLTGRIWRSGVDAADAGMTKMAVFLEKMCRKCIPARKMAKKSAKKRRFFQKKT